MEEMERESKSVVDWSEYDSAKAMLEGETADSLKEALKKLGLKCGGTPLQRAERLFTATVRNGADVNGTKIVFDGKKLSVPLFDRLKKFSLRCCDVGGTNSLDAKAAYKRECRVLEAKIGYLVEEVLSDIVSTAIEYKALSMTPMSMSLLLFPSIVYRRYTFISDRFLIERLR